jgi:L-ascorbate metabolism protein UlaG (beta-lactamase superfamily)
MDIKYLGHSSFFIKGKSASVVTDPYLSGYVGLKFPKHVAADIVTVSHDHDDHNAVSQVEGDPFTVSGPGEYEIKGVSIIGIPVYHDPEKGSLRGKNTMFRIEIDGVSIVHVGDLGHPLSTSEVDQLGSVDILLLPVGGVYTIDAAVARQVVSDVKPSIVIPMHYKRPDLDAKFDGLTGFDVFLKEMDKQDTAAQPKLSITKDKIPEEMQVIVLE